MASIINLTNHKTTQIELHQFTESDVTEILQNTLGVTPLCSYKRWCNGVDLNPKNSYIEMRVAFDTKDIVASPSGGSWADKMLEDCAANVNYNSDIIESLKPFMYPNDFYALSQDALQKLYKQGLFGDRLNELNKFRVMTFVKDFNKHIICLRPERLIMHYFTDPTTGKIQDDIKFLGVSGGISSMPNVPAEPITWYYMKINKSSTPFSGSVNDVMDRLFAASN